MNTLFQRPEGHLPLYANVGIIFGKRNVCGGNSAGISNSFQLLSTVKMQGGEHINLRTNGSYVEQFDALLKEMKNFLKILFIFWIIPQKLVQKSSVFSSSVILN